MFIFKLCFFYILTIGLVPSLNAGEAISEASIYVNQLRSIQNTMRALDELATESSEEGDEDSATYYQQRWDADRQTAERIKKSLNAFGSFNYDDYEDPELAKLYVGIRYTPDGIGYDTNGIPINITKEAKGKEKEDFWLQRKKAYQKTFIPYKCLSIAVTFIGAIFLSDKFFKSYIEEEKKKFNLLPEEEKTKLIKLNQTPEKRRWSLNICMGLMTSSIVSFIVLLL